MIIVTWQNNEIKGFVLAIMRCVTVADILFLTEVSTGFVNFCKGWVGESP